jgi:hypothetical protein
MRYKMLDTVVLARDLPAHHLCSGDLGAVVDVYEPDGIAVEFVTASGHTSALVTLKTEDVRPIADTDQLTARSPSIPASMPEHPYLQASDPPAESPDGVDLTLIQWTLSLTPLQRLELLQDWVDGLTELRRGAGREAEAVPPAAGPPPPG